jgi:hypothetical protein
LCQIEIKTDFFKHVLKTAHWVQRPCPKESQLFLIDTYPDKIPELVFYISGKLFNTIHQVPGVRFQGISMQMKSGEKGFIIGQNYHFSGCFMQIEQEV